jgi:hypothetical protein
MTRVNIGVMPQRTEVLARINTAREVVNGMKIGTRR